MDVIEIVKSVPLSIAIVIAVLVLAPTVFAIVRIWAESRAKRQDAETRIKELDSQSKIEIARVEAEGKIQVAKLEADAKVNTAQLELEKAKQQAVTQKQQIEREAKLATENDTYRTQADAMRLAQATALQETARALVRLSIGQNATEATVKGAESRLGAMVEGARDLIIEGIKDYRDFSLLYWGMLIEDPPASRGRLKRAREAWDEGDMQKVQAVADEDVAGVAGNEGSPVAIAEKEVIQP